MVFSSIPFLYYFLPSVLLIYFIAPKKLKNTVLLLSSLFFYAWGEPKFVLAMLIAIFQGYVFGILIEKNKGRPAKAFVATSVFISVGILAYCKYADFFIENFNNITGLSVPFLNIALPIGISFYTFQILSYVVDVYRCKVPAQRNIINLAAYVAMFPQLIAGPIVRYSDISGQLEKRTHSLEKCAVGVRRFVIGLGKKVLLANVLGELCECFRASDDKSVLFFWMYAIGVTLHIYFDFSGYSDMAIGLGKIFGFDFTENFNYPYISKSITEFWRRWHISLGSWFRDYVYIPLGGNRVAKWRWLCNIMIVWMLTGFWHGAEWKFVLWGLYFGILLINEKIWLGRLLDKTKIIRHIYVIFAVVISFILFDCTEMSEAVFIVKAMFGSGDFALTSPESVYYLRSYAIVFVMALVGSTPLMTYLVEKIRKNVTGKRVMNIIEPLFLIFVLLIATGYIIDGSFNPFLYFRF